MRISMHDRTPEKATSKLFKYLLVVCCVLLYSPFVIVACSIFFDYSEASIPGIITGVLLIALPPVVVLLLLIYLYGMKKSYAEIDGENVLIADYYLFGKKEKIIARSSISKRETVLASSLKCPGRRLHPIGQIIYYIVFKDSSDKYLFKVIKTPESLEWSNKSIEK